AQPSNIHPLPTRRSSDLQSPLNMVPSVNSLTLPHCSLHQSPLNMDSSRYPQTNPACSAHHPALNIVEVAVSITPFHFSDHQSPRSEEHTSELQSRFDHVC